MHPKFIIVSRPDNPLTGLLVYGNVGSHRELIEGYVKNRGGGWYNKDDEKKTIVLYGSSEEFSENGYICILKPQGDKQLNLYLYENKY